MGRASVLNAPILDMSQLSEETNSCYDGHNDTPPSLPIPKLVIHNEDGNIKTDTQSMLDAIDNSALLHEDDDICAFLSGDEDALALSEDTEISDRSSIDSDRSGAFGLDCIREEDESE